MTQASATPPAKTRWYRLTAPAELGDLASGVWFMGHAQLFLAAAALLIGTVGLVGTAVISITAGEYTPSGWLAAVLALPFAAAFLFSGLALRVVAAAVDARTTPVGRAVTIAGMMLLIAAGAIVIAVIGIGAMIIGSFELSGGLS